MVQVIVRCKTKFLACKTSKSSSKEPSLKPSLLVRNHERIGNEAKALQLISDRTTIPVPKLIDYGTHPDGRQYLVTELVRGKPLKEFIGNDGAETAYANALDFVENTLMPQLEKLRSNERGIDGFVMPPCWICPDVEPPWKGKTSWKTLPLKEPGYIFQHGDIAAHNIMMDETTLQVIALIDWEYAGFFPPGMERWHGTLDQSAYDTRGEDVAQAISDFLPEEYLECYDQWANKEELDLLIKDKKLPDPQVLKSLLLTKHT